MEIAVELMLPSPTAIPCSFFAFVKATGGGGQGESLLYRVLHFTAANYCSRGEWPFAAGHVAGPGFHSLLQQYKFLCHD